LRQRRRGRRSPLPQRNSPLRTQVDSATTSFFQLNGGRSLITGNRIFGSRQFSIAVSQARGFTINNNRLSLSNGVSTFREALHFENRANGCGVGFNTITVNRGQEGFRAAIGLGTFTDYGNAQNFSNGVRRMTFNNNTIQGSGGRGFVGSGFSGITFNGNDLTGLTNGEVYAFFNVPGGRNNFASRTGNRPFNP